MCLFFWTKFALSTWALYFPSVKIRNIQRSCSVSLKLRWIWDRCYRCYLIISLRARFIFQLWIIPYIKSRHHKGEFVTKAKLEEEMQNWRGANVLLIWECSDVSRKGGILRASSMCSVFLCENNPNQPSAVLLDVFSLKALTGASLTLWLPSFPATDLELTSESRVSHFVIRGFFFFPSLFLWVKMERNLF